MGTALCLPRSLALAALLAVVAGSRLPEGHRVSDDAAGPGRGRRGVDDDRPRERESLAQRFHGGCRKGCIERLKGAPEHQGCDLSKVHIRHNQEHLSGEQA
jgi:hypothetical protein